MLGLVPPRPGAELSSGHPEVPSWADVQYCVFGSQCSISACASEHKAGHCTSALHDSSLALLWEWPWAALCQQEQARCGCCSRQDPLRAGWKEAAQTDRKHERNMDEI